MLQQWQPLPRTGGRFLTILGRKTTRILRVYCEMRYNRASSLWTVCFLQFQYFTVFVLRQDPKTAQGMAWPSLAFSAALVEDGELLSLLGRRWLEATCYEYKLADSCDAGG